MRSTPLAVWSPTPSPLPPSAPVVPRVPGKGPTWLSRNPAFTLATLAALVVMGTAVAALLIRQDVSTTVTVVAPDVVFEAGRDYSAAHAAGFATLTLGTSATSARLDLAGIAGATWVSATNVMNLTNLNASHAYVVTLARSGTPNVAITDLTVVVKNGADVVATWNAATTQTSDPFELPSSTRLDVSVRSTIQDGTALGALGLLGMQFSIVPA